MSFENLVKTRKNVLSSGNVSGSYDFWTTIISLDSIDSITLKRIEQLLLDKKDDLTNCSNIPISDFKNIIDIQSLARHEYTHYIDCCSTLWGFKYLTLMSSAYECNSNIYKEVDETNYKNAKVFFDTLRFIRLPKYFTLLGKADGDDQKWMYAETIGNRFTLEGTVSDHPVLFMRFLDSSKELIVRSPVSALSILECSAMAQEILYKKNEIQKRLNFYEYKIEMQQYERELKDYFYNKSITEYSVCAHLVASKLKISSIFEVFKACSILCRFVLNASDMLYELIIKQCDFEKLFGIDRTHDFIKRIIKGLEYREPGFLFYLMCRFLDGNSGSNVSVDYIRKCFSDHGVTMKDYDDNLIAEKNNFLKLIEQFKSPYIKKIALRGVANFDIIKKESSSICFYDLDLPPAYLGDGEVYRVFPKNRNNDYLDELDELDELYENLITGQFWVERFIEAC